MKGDFSRRTFNKNKNYSGVLKQQGRVSLDSDANELIEIQSRQRRIRTKDIIGPCCAPVHAGGFQIRYPGNSLKDLLISIGRIYVNGHLCELHPGRKIPVVFPSGTVNSVQVNELKIDGYTLSVNQWVLVFTDENPDGIPASIISIDEDNNILKLSNDLSGLHSGTAPKLQRLILYSEQEDYPGAPDYEPGSTDLIYLDVWERHITALEDSGLYEPALGGPDTATRIKTICQVKFKKNVNAVNCTDSIPEWENETAPGGGRLTTQTKPGTDPEDPCLIAEGGGYKGLENRLYRVEIHDAGNIGTATFKWSRDNGSIAYAIQEFIPDDTDPSKVFKVRLKQLGRDKNLKIKKNDRLEISGDETDLNTDNVGIITKVTDINEAQMIITLNDDISIHKNEAHPKVRRWDTGIETLSPPTKTGAGVIELEDGVQIEFFGDNFKTGDYWIFAARTVTGEIEILDKEPPAGIKHSYCKLALIKWDADGNADITDCRNEFLNLCELSKIKPGGKVPGCCTVTVGEDGDYNDIQQAVNALNGGPGTICILPGFYSVKEPVKIEGRDITIKSCGGKSLIFNGSKSPVFEITNSWGVEIIDLWIISNGGRTILSVNSQYVRINDCTIIAFGSSDNPGAIVFQGLSIESEVADSLIGGIVGVLFEEYPESNININLSFEIKNNIVFALRSAILQTSGATLFAFIVSDNILLGFTINAFMKVFFPPEFVKYAEKENMFDKSKINDAKKVKRDVGGIETATRDNAEPLNMFGDYLKSEASTARLSAEYGLTEIQVITSSAVIDLQSGAVDANIINNILLGAAGIQINILLESAIEKNIIAAFQTGITLGMFEGAAILDNFIMSALAGIKCSGTLAMNLTASGNRITSSTDGIAFLDPGSETAKFQLIVNCQLSLNFITASNNGIKILNPAVFIYDFTAFDNSILGSAGYGIVLIGLDENLFSAEDNTSFQRVIQRNSVQVKGAGIVTGVSDSKIIDNDITISFQQEEQNTNLSYGICLLAPNCTAESNSVQGKVDIPKNILSKGGILIYMPPAEKQTAGTIIMGNRIYGGIGNGVEIASEIDDLVNKNTAIDDLNIDGNLIRNMGLNGIAVQEGILSTDNISITNNKIERCNFYSGNIAFWWKYAGILLKSGENIKIAGNEILENGVNIEDSKIQTGGIYAEQVINMIISGNQFINNGNQKIASTQAVIHIPANPEKGNEDIKVVDNVVKGSAAPALFLGGEYSSGTVREKYKLVYGLDMKTIITGNHFESLINGPAVDLQCSRTVFSDNYVECRAMRNRCLLDSAGT